MSTNYRKILICGGADLPEGYAGAVCSAQKPDFIIAADRGFHLLKKCGIIPDLLLGDYDSLESSDLREASERGGDEQMPILTYPAEKNFSDIEAALQEAVQREPGLIILIGVTGGRLDHFLAVLQNLRSVLRTRIPTVIMDGQNILFLSDRSFHIMCAENDDEDSTSPYMISVRFGRGGGGHSFDLRADRKPEYISFLPLGETFSGLTLRGLKYPLEDYDFSAENASLTISNEFAGSSSAEILFDGGTLAVILSNNRSL